MRSPYGDHEDPLPGVSLLVRMFQQVEHIALFDMCAFCPHITA